MSSNLLVLCLWDLHGKMVVAAKAFYYITLDESWMDACGGILRLLKFDWVVWAGSVNSPFNTIPDYVSGS